MGWGVKTGYRLVIRNKIGRWWSMTEVSGCLEIRINRFRRRVTVIINCLEMEIRMGHWLVVKNKIWNKIWGWGIKTGCRLDIRNKIGHEVKNEFWCWRFLTVFAICLKI